MAKERNRAFFWLFVCMVAIPLGALAETPWDPKPILKAFIFQQEVKIDGEIATAAIIASEQENGLAALSRRSPEIESMVLSVLKKDDAQHRMEYQARRHIANAESLGPEIKWNLAAVQEHLWSKFFDDPRWVRRVMLQLQDEAARRKLSIDVGPIPPAQELNVSEQTVHRICAKLTGHKKPSGPPCGANPELALRDAKGEDPMLVAVIFPTGWFPGTEEECAQAAFPELERAGWKISGRGAAPAAH